MVEKKNYVIGIILITLLVASGVVYLQFSNQVKIRIDKDQTTFYVPHEDYSWIWTVSGREQNRLFDGTSIMNRQTSGITIETIVNESTRESTIIRTTPYIRGPVVIDTYKFNGNIHDVKLFPISHTVEIINGSGYFYRYSVDDLTVIGDKRKLDGETYLKFGKNMDIELNPNYRWAWIGWPYGSESLSAQYNINSDDEIFKVRLFDPVQTDIILNYPLDEQLIENYTLPVNFNVSVSPSSGEYLTNVSLYTNHTGSWLINDTSYGEINEIYDNFNDNDLNLSLWTNYSAGVGTCDPGDCSGYARESSQELEIDSTSGGSYGPSAAHGGNTNSYVKDISNLNVYGWTVGSLTSTSGASCGGNGCYGEARVRVLVGATTIADKTSCTNNGGTHCSSPTYPSTYNDLSTGDYVLNRTNTTHWSLYKDGVFERSFISITGNLSFTTQTRYHTATGSANAHAQIYIDDVTYADIGAQDTIIPIQFEIPYKNVIWNVQVCGTTGNCNFSDSNFSFSFLDNSPPQIEYAPNSDSSNKVTNFGSKDWIFINVTVSDFFENSTTFNLYNSTGIINQTIYTDGTDNINWTDLPTNGMYLWNVSTCDTSDNCNTTTSRYYGIENTNISINGLFENLLVELGSELIVNSTNNLDNVYLDINHPHYGINYSVGKFLNSEEIAINSFNKSTLANGQPNGTFTGFYYNETSGQFENVSSLNITGHQYDEVDNLYFNISGQNGVKDLTFYKTNSTSFDRAYQGYLQGNNIYLNTTYDGSNKTNLSYPSEGEKFIYFYLDDNSTFSEMLFNLSGFEYGFEYEDGEYGGYFDNFSDLDINNSNATFSGGLITAGGNNPQSFYYDDFEDASINSALWTFGYANGLYGTPGGGCPGDCYYLTIDNGETGGHLKLRTDMEEHFNPGESGTFTDTNPVVVNSSQINLWTAEGIYIDFSYDNVGNEDHAAQACRFSNDITLGGSEIYSSKYDFCINNDGGLTVGSCQDNAESIGNIHVNATKQTNSSWLIEIDGVEKTFGTADYGDGASDCGTFTKTYNWTNGTLYTDFTAGSCPYLTRGYTSLNNSFFVAPEWNGEDPVAFVQDYYALWDGGDDLGCNDLDINFKINSINQTLLNRTNSSAISQVVFSSPSDITAITPDPDFRGEPGYIGTPYTFLSADGGSNWELAADASEHIFSSQGKEILYKIVFDVGSGGYLNNTIFMDYINLSTSKAFPSNIDIDFGNDGTSDYTFSGELNTTNSPIRVDVSSADLTNSFTEKRTLYDHVYKIPVRIVTDTVGLIQIDDINLTYNPNPIYLNTTSIQNYLSSWGDGYTNFSVPFGANSGGVNISDINYLYAGGNQTYTFLAHNSDYSQNVSRNVTYYYSRWDYDFNPSGIDYILFSPRNPTSKNVTPYGQSSLIPILNITDYSYGGQNQTLSIYQNGSLSCVNTTISLTNNKNNGVQIGASWINLTNLTYLGHAPIYLWADYDCSYNNWTLFQPQYYFRLCESGTICSEEII